MNVEELKLVLETISQITDGAGAVAMLWMVLHYATPILTTAIVVGGLAYFGIVCARMLISMNEWAEAGKAVARAGGAQASSFIFSRDREAIDRAIQLLKEMK